MVLVMSWVPSRSSSVKFISERNVAELKAAKQRGTRVDRPQALTGSRRDETRRMLAAGKSQG